MRLAIISNGPSARLFDEAERSDFDLVAGVNWTVKRWLCDWWVFCDYVTFQDTVPLGKPALFLKRAALRKIHTHSKPGTSQRLLEHEVIVAHEDGADIPIEPNVGFWNNFSGPAALGLAIHLGADRVTVFGADMSGDMDHAGRVGTSRTPDRWERERGIWAASVAYLHQIGISVQRIGEDGHAIN